MIYPSHFAGPALFQKKPESLEQRNILDIPRILAPMNNTEASSHLLTAQLFCGVCAIDLQTQEDNMVKAKLHMYNV